MIQRAKVYTEYTTQSHISRFSEPLAITHDTIVTTMRNCLMAGGLRLILYSRVQSFSRRLI